MKNKFINYCDNIVNCNIFGQDNGKMQCQNDPMPKLCVCVFPVLRQCGEKVRVGSLIFVPKISTAFLVNVNCPKSSFS